VSDVGDSFIGRLNALRAEALPDYTARGIPAEEITEDGLLRYAWEHMNLTAEDRVALGVPRTEEEAIEELELAIVSYRIQELAKQGRLAPEHATLPGMRNCWPPGWPPILPHHVQLVTAAGRSSPRPAICLNGSGSGKARSSPSWATSPFPLTTIWFHTALRPHAERVFGYLRVFF
jgi:hypothetical protein